MQSRLMIYKVSLPVGFALGWLTVRAVRSRLDDRTLKRAPFYAVGGLLLFFGLAAALRFGFELEFMFPEFVRTKATFFKWTAMEAVLAFAFGSAAAAEAGKRARKASGVAWLAGLTRREAMSFFLIMAVVLGAESWKLAPVHKECRNIVNDNGITIQSLDSTCGPAALSTLMRTFGFEVTEGELARVGGTRTNGMTGGELCDVAAEFGFSHNYVVTDSMALISDGRPCLLGVGDDHWVTFLGFNGRIGKYVIADPSFGIDLVDRKSLAETWRGKALYLTPSGRIQAGAAAGSASMPAGSGILVAVFDQPDSCRLPGLKKLLGLM